MSRDAPWVGKAGGRHACNAHDAPGHGRPAALHRDPVPDEAAGIEAGLSPVRDIDDPAGLASPPPEWREGLPAMPGGREVIHGG
jgi:hypothetical protein